MKMNLPLYLMDYPIQPQHINADVLYRTAEQIVLLCQRKGGWYPFAVSELAGITSYQLRQIRGLILINNQFHLSHDFISMTLSFAPAVNGKEQEMLILRAHKKAMNTVFYQTWHHIPEVIAIVSFLLSGFMINIWQTGSVIEAVGRMIVWPMGPYSLSTLALWLTQIGVGLFWLSRQRKRVCLAPMLNWYSGRPSQSKRWTGWRRWAKGFR